MTTISSQASPVAPAALARLTSGWSTQFLRFIERHGEIIQIHNEIDRRRRLICRAASPTWRPQPFEIHDFVVGP